MSLQKYFQFEKYNKTDCTRHPVDGAEQDVQVTAFPDLNTYSPLEISSMTLGPSLIKD